MHYLVTLKAEGLVRDEHVADRDDVYVSPEGVHEPRLSGDGTI